MKEVVIDNSKELVLVNGRVIPRMLLRLMRGAVGKSFVVKHFRGRGRVVTRFPDMSGIVPTEKQKVRRDLFREAVVWAKWVIADEGRKLAFKNTLPRKKRKKVYQAALQLYMKMRGNKQWLRKQWAICNRQLANECVDVRKQLAGKAVVESVKHETSNVNGGYEQRGQWRVLWKKRKEVVDVTEQEVDNGCLMALRI